MSKPIQESIGLAMAAILADIQAIAKNKKNEQQGFNFRGIDSFYDALHPIFSAHGVICLPNVEQAETKEIGKNSKGNAIYQSSVSVMYRFTATDGSFVEARAAGSAFDSSDKGMGKAMSYCHKYILIQTFLIPVRDLEDQDAYDPTIDAREELKKLREEAAKAAVKDAVATGETPELTAEQAAEMARKKEEAALAYREKHQGDDPRLIPGQKEISPVADAEEDGAPVGKKPAPKKEPEKPAEEKAEGWETHVMALNVSGVKGQSLGEISPELIKKCKEKWVDVNWETTIKNNPTKKHEAEMVKLAFAHHFPAGKK